MAAAVGVAEGVTQAAAVGVAEEVTQGAAAEAVDTVAGMDSGAAAAVGMDSGAADGEAWAVPGSVSAHAAWRARWPRTALRRERLRLTR